MRHEGFSDGSVTSPGAGSLSGSETAGMSQSPRVRASDQDGGGKDG